MLPDSESPTTAPSRSAQSQILLIRQDTTTTVYRDAVLKKAGFLVKVATPSDVPAIVNNGIASYSVVVMSDTLTFEDTQEIMMRLRQYSPQLKILLMERPDSPGVDPTLYDATVDGLNGAEMLIGAVRRLTAS